MVNPLFRWLFITCLIISTIQVPLVAAQLEKIDVWVILWGTNIVLILVTLASSIFISICFKNPSISQMVPPLMVVVGLSLVVVASGFGALISQPQMSMSVRMISESYVLLSCSLTSCLISICITRMIFDRKREVSVEFAMTEETSGRYENVPGATVGTGQSGMQTTGSSSHYDRCPSNVSTMKGAKTIKCEKIAPPSRVKGPTAIHMKPQ